MGTDLGPEPMLAGVRAALAADPEVECIAVGTADALADIASDDRLAAHAASEVIEPNDEPAIAVRSLRDSSTLRAMELVRDGRAAAVVSAASTGAVVLAAGAVLRRAAGVAHPALASVMAGTTFTVVVDCGATTRREPTWLVHNAHLGVALAEVILEGEPASVGLLANGVESIKGDGAIRTADRLLRTSHLRYLGFVEPDALYSAEPHVLVTDGLVGNILLKTIEATWRAVVAPISEELDEAKRRAALPERPEAPPSPSARFTGGALLLGVRGVVVKAHGLGTARGAADAVALAASAVRTGLGSHLAAGIGT
jgi:glycerol-3-phosphate acyltransferase PlsX